MKNFLIKNVSFAVVDIETTGLSPRAGNRICEIAVLRVKGGRKVGSFESLVNPERPISRGASFVNGITDDMVRNSPKFGEVVNDVLGLLNDAVIVCHNAPFDLGFIAHHMQGINLPLLNNPVVDTLKLARRHYNFSSNSLGSIARELCITVRNEHRAMGDVLTTRKVLDCFLEDFIRDKGVRKLKDLLEA